MREHWASRLGFILAACGSAVGLGVLWKLPYVMALNGGGAFFLVYLLSTLFLGIPIFIGEILLGRASERAAVGTFIALTPEHKGWRAIGWLGVLACFFVLSYYCVVAGWGLSYLMMSLNHTMFTRPQEELTSLFDLLSQSGDISLLWASLFLLITYGVVLKGVRQGIEFWSRILMTALMGLLLILLFYAMQLEGFGESVRFLTSLDFSALKPMALVEAVGLSFFTLSLAEGVMITYGSYLRTSEDVPMNGLIIGAVVILIAFLASLVIFPVIFTFHLPMEEGTGLIFKTLPLLFAQLPGSMMISTLFFALFVFAGLTSAVGLVEVIVANFMDLFHLSRKRAVNLTTLACFIIIIPSAYSFSPPFFSKWPEIFGTTFFGTLDSLVSVWFLPIGGFFLTLYLGWRLQKRLLQEQFTMHSKLGKLFMLWFFIIRWIAPLAMVFLFLEHSGIMRKH